MIQYILIALAALLKAVADTCQDHYGISIFQNWNPKFWNKAVSWQDKKFLGIVVLDAFHLSYYGVFGCLFALPFFSLNALGYYNYLLFWLIYFIIFELFYSHILIKK